MSPKELYSRYSTPDLPLFHQPFWLNATAQENWDVALVKEGDKIIASMPYAFEKKKPILFIRGPHLTQFLGPHYSIEASNHREYLNRETEILNLLIDQLPPFAFFEQRWHFHYQNYLPFHWKNFQQRTRYTYILPNLKDESALLNGFNEKIKREIKKGENAFHVQSENISADSFYRFIESNLSDKKYQLPFDTVFFERLYNSCVQNNAGKIFLALDADQKIAAGIFVAWDATTAYYIIGAKDNDYGNSGAMTFLFSRVFKELSEKVTVFNFEGSMISGVERYFRSFGAIQKTFFEITRTDSKLVFLTGEIKKTIHFLFRK